MKYTLVVLLIFLFSNSFAGGFMFPNVSYDYARVYLLNANPDASSERPDFSVYRNGIYAASKCGNGLDFTEQMNAQLNTVFRMGVGAMAMGLSGCYIPRHGIIYFDKLGNPVASLSICFECQRIYFWSTAELPEFKSTYSDKEIAKAEKQFDQLETIFVTNQIPVFKSADEYVAHVAGADSLYSNSGEIILDLTNQRAFGTAKFTAADIKTWALDDNFKLREEQETTFSAREGDTHSWTYLKLTHPSGTRILFTTLEDDAVLTEASIVNAELKLPNGIRVGMSLDQVQSSFTLWDGLEHPASIIANYADANIRYVFENRTLRRIELVMI